MGIAAQKSGSTILAASVATAGFVPTFMLGALSIEIRTTVPFTYAELGLILASFSAASALLSPSAGRLVERIGASRGLMMATVATSVVLVSIGAFARTWPMLAALAFAGGMANATIQLGTNLLIAREVPQHRHGIAFGIKMSAVPAATLLAGVAVPVAGLWIGWRATFIGVGLLCLPLGWACRRAGAPPAARPRATRPVRLDRRRLVVLAGAAGFGMAAGNALGGFIVPAGVASGLSASMAGALLVAASVATIATRILGGWSADRSERSPLRAVAALLLAGAGGVYLLGTGSPAHFALGVIIGFVGGLGWNGLLSLDVVRTYPVVPAAATGVVQSGLALGAGIGPITFGYLAESFSYRIAWSAAALSLAVATLFIAVAARMHPRTTT